MNVGDEGRERCAETQHGGFIDDNKRAGVTRLFAVNCNGFGPESYDKLDQTQRSGENHKLDGILISSSDTRWCTRSKNRLNNKLKCFSPYVAINTSDSREVLEEGKTFLKGGTVTATWGDLKQCENKKERKEHDHGWWNVMGFEGNGRRLAIIPLHRIVDNNNNV